MTESAGLLADLRRYAGMIRATILGSYPFQAEAEDANSVQVERGVILPRALSNVANEPENSPIERLITLAAHPKIRQIAVVDRTGHHRPVYRALLVYSWLQAFSLRYETLPRPEFGRWEEALRVWCDLMEAELGEIDLMPGPIPAARGSSVTEAAWIALSLQIAGKVFIRDAWTDLAADTFGKLTRFQHGSGALLHATASDNPDTHAYHELVLLHAATGYAVQAEDRTIAAAVARATEYHQAQTQPDHATTQPWALFAFIWNANTHPLADQILHAATQNNSAVSLMLLADALYCLELFTKP
jgi:hypothetical protein